MHGNNEACTLLNIGIDFIVVKETSDSVILWCHWWHSGLRLTVCGSFILTLRQLRLERRRALRELFAF